MQYKPHGVCSRAINVELDGDIIKSVEFIGGCAGNTMGISHLIKGMNVDEAIERLSGIRCGQKPTSCPDQLSYALRAAKEAAK